MLESAAPRSVVYCHCEDCRRWTGAPVTAFAGVPEETLHLTPARDPKSATAGVERWNCPDCGSPLAARFDYLPGMVFLPLGILDQAAALAPERHCHADKAIDWLHITDTLPRDGGSARATLNQK